MLHGNLRSFLSICYHMWCIIEREGGEGREGGEIFNSKKGQTHFLVMFVMSIKIIALHVLINACKSTAHIRACTCM